VITYKVNGEASQVDDATNADEFAPILDERVLDVLHKHDDERTSKMKKKDDLGNTARFLGSSSRNTTRRGVCQS
jgi:hypothetical protein